MKLSIWALAALLGATMANPFRTSQDGVTAAEAAATTTHRTRTPTHTPKTGSKPTHTTHPRGKGTKTRTKKVKSTKTKTKGGNLTSPGNTSPTSNTSTTTSGTSTTTSSTSTTTSKPTQTPGPGCPAQPVDLCNSQSQGCSCEVVNALFVTIYGTCTDLGLFGIPICLPILG